MKAVKHANRSPYILLFSIALLLFATANVSASKTVNLRVDRSTSSIDTGGNFDVTTRIENRDTDNITTDDDIDLELYFNDVLVHQHTYNLNIPVGVTYNITVNSESFKIDDDNIDLWDGNLMEYQCADNAEIKVQVSGDVSSESDTDTLDIRGDELSFSLDPSAPDLSSDVLVSVKNRNDNDFSGAKIRVVWLADPAGSSNTAWDKEDKTRTYTADSHGEKTINLGKDFGKDDYGKYEFDAYYSSGSDNYCLDSKTFDVSNTLNISVEPASPKVGESFKLKILTSGGKAATGVKVRMSPGNIEKIVRSDGYTDSFTVSSPATYTFITSSTTFSETMYDVNIAQMPSLSVAVSPDPQELSNPVIITVKSSGSPIQGAAVTVSRTGGLVSNLPGTTATDGTISYTPTETGEYTVKASKTGYEDGTDTFSVQNKLVVTVPAADELQKGKEVQIVVKDQSGNPVSGAAVTVSSSAISGSTDANGTFKMTLDRTGSYQLTVSKSGFSDGSVSFVSKGTLRVIVTKDVLELGGSEVIRVSDTDGNVISADIVVKDSSGASQTASASEYTYTSTKVGSYTVDVSKQDYATAHESFNVNPKKLTVKSAFAGDQLVINATSYGSPVRGLSFNVKMPDSSEAMATTDDSGVASLPSLTQYGNYTIESISTDYTASTDTLVREKGLGGVGIIIIIVIAILVLLILIALVLATFIRGRSSKGAFTPRARGTKLGGM